MTESAPADAPEVIERFAALVALVSERPTAAEEQRTLVRAVVAAAKKQGATITAGEDGSLTSGDQPLDLPFLAKRFKSNGIEELGITGKAAVADLLDLARMLAAEPAGTDPAAAFAGRAAVLDAKALPRRLRPRSSEPLAPPRPSAATPARSSARVTPLRTPTLSPPAPSEPAASAEDADPKPRASDPSRRALEPANPEEPVRLERALAVPVPSHPALASAVVQLAAAESDVEDNAQLGAALEELTQQADLAFRQGRHDDLVEAMAALVGLEHLALERDSSDERRQLFNHALKRLTIRPMLVRQLAVMRHTRHDDEVSRTRLQAILYRYGTYGADVLADEYVSAPTTAARLICLGALRELRRTHDALLLLARSTSLADVREAASILGELRDAPSEEILLELLHHPEPRARRAAVAALGNFATGSSLEAIASVLGDEVPGVRLRAVSALGARREARVVAMLSPLLDGESSTEVLFSAVGAVGAVATPEAVQLLIRIAQGEGSHPQRRSAPLRVLACTALVAVRSPTAMAAVQALRDDRDAAVREASMRLVAQASRRSTTSSQAIVAQP